MMNLPPLNLPEARLRITKDSKGNVRVYDRLRKKDVVLTPEEFVRQHFVEWLLGKLGYPASMVANEIGIEVNGAKKRCDTVVFGRDGNPLMIIEYKAPNVSITQDTFDQIFRYNLKLRAKYLIVSNGIRHYCCVIDYENGTYNFIPKVPDYLSLYILPESN